MADISVFDFGDGVERNVKDATARSGLTGKADKVTGATNGNLAKLDSNGNLQDSGVAAGNVVQKSSTTGLLKNDGSVDTHTYVKTSNTAGLLKNDGTVDTTTYASEAGTESLINSTVGWTGKNLLDVPSTIPTISGLTITTDANKHVKMNGTAGASGAIIWNGGYTLHLKAGSYKLIVSPDKTMPSGSFNIRNSSEATIAAINLSTELTKDFTVASDTDVRAFLNINSGNVYSDVTIGFMIMDARITDATYEPYHKSVEECKADNTVIAPVENGATASKAYAQNEYFIRNGALCVAITAIASGATLTLNTNYITGDVAGIIKRDTLTGTTGAIAGTIVLPTEFKAPRKRIISAYTLDTLEGTQSGTGIIILPYTNGYGTWGFKAVNTSDMAAVKSKSLTIYYEYI